MLHDIILFLVGIVVGAMNAIAGGGMLVGLPVLIAAGLPALVANATSSIVTMPGQLSSAYGYRKYLARTPRRYMLLMLPCVAGAVVGATLLRNTSSASFDRFVPGLILFAVALFTFQPLIHRELHRHLHGPKRHRQRLQPLLLIALAMLPASVYGGYFGAGFGFIMLAFLSFSKLHQIHQMNAIKNLLAVSLNAAALICLVGSNLIDWHHGLWMAAGGLIGGYYGATAAQKVSSHAIRIVVIVVGVSAAAYLFATSH